jgi:hypothetical protein
MKDVTVKEVNPTIKELVEENGGFCPCAIVKNEDTRCPCKDFREQRMPGKCHCGRYEKIERESE